MFSIYLVDYKDNVIHQYQSDFVPRFNDFIAVKYAEYQVRRVTHILESNYIKIMVTSL